MLTNVRDNNIELLQIEEVDDTSVPPSAPRDLRFVAMLALPRLRLGCRIVSFSCHTDPIRRSRNGTVADNKMEEDPYSGSDCSDKSSRRLSAGSGMHCRPDSALVHFRAYIHRDDHPVTHFSFVARREELLQYARTTFRTDTQDRGLLTSVSWDTWGPGATRWGGSDEADAAWMASISGQRSVVIIGENPRPICVRDYNVHTVRRTQAASGSVGRRSSSRVKIVTEESRIAHQDCFMEDVRSSLPYVEVSSEKKYDFDAVLISDEHLVGITVREASYGFPE